MKSLIFDLNQMNFMLNGVINSDLTLIVQRDIVLE